MEDARGPVVRAALAEARARGDRRLGTEHLLLGMLHDPVAVHELGVDLDAAHRALEELDQAALSAIGLDVTGLRLTGRLPAGGRRPALTSGAREVLLRSITGTTRRHRRPTSKQMLLALLACQRPDPAAELLAQLGVDTEAVRLRLDGAQS